jgi:hypothetical protein
MGYGNELILGWKLCDDDCPYKDDKVVKKFLKKKPPFGRSDDYEYINQWEIKLAKTVESKVKAIHKQCLLFMNFDITKESDDYIFAETPEGEREFSHMRLEVHFDPYEMRERPEDALIGISISSRYFPVFADWRDPSGGMWNIQVSPETEEMQVARQCIVDGLPEFSTARYYVKEKHY